MCVCYVLLNDMCFICCYSFSLFFKENKYFEIMYEIGLYGYIWKLD